MSWPGPGPDINAAAIRDAVDREIISMVHTNIRGNTMGIGDAVKNLMDGRKVARTGWNGKDMWLKLVAGNVDKRRLAFVEMKTADGWMMPWLCSQSDLLANDWEVVG